MVDTGTSVPKIRNQIAFIAREVAVLQADYERLAVTNAQAQPEVTALSEPAKRLLFEIELCNASSPKGISILRVTDTEGDYLAHLYNSQPPNQIRLLDLNVIIAATDELVTAGYLEFHSAEGKVAEYRRTKLIIPL